MTDNGRRQSQFYLLLNGERASAELMRDLERISVESSLHLPDVATLVLHDPRLRWVDHSLTAPGVALKVIARVGSAEAPLFEGEIVELEPEFVGAAPRLLVRAFDRLHRLARGRHARVFADTSDAELVRRLADEVGLRWRVGPAAGRAQPYVLQANESNLALLQRRAAAIGYLLYVDGETLCFVPPGDAGASQPLTWGENLIEFRPRLTTVEQVSTVTVRGWDMLGKRPVFGQTKGGDGAAPSVGAGRRGGAVAEQAHHVRADLLISHLPVANQAAADLLAGAVADRRGARFVEAEGLCHGEPGLSAGMAVEVRAVGARFAGTYFVTAVRHSGDASGGYETSFQISGLTPATLLGLLAAELDTVPPPALAVAVVADNDDPDGMGRVRLAFPWLNPEVSSAWARVVAAGAGDQRGIAFLPEVGDEVLVGFEMGDLQQPYVLGGLWNGVDRPPPTAGGGPIGTVQRRVIRSRSGHEIILDDGESGGVTIRDRRGNTIIISSGDGAITVQSSGDMALRSSGSLTLEASGAVTISGAGVSVDGGSGEVDVKGSMINLN